MRANARIEHDDVPAQAVSEQSRRFIRSKMVEQRVEIGEIVGEPVSIERPVGKPESAPIRRDDVPLSLQGIDEKLKRCADVHPAMQHEELRRVRLTPGADVIAEAADGNRQR